MALKKLTLQLPSLQRWEHAGAGRYYQAMVQRNLLGDWEILRMWGGIGRGHGGQQCTPLPDQEAGAQALGETAHRRAQRGYLPVSARNA